MTVPRPASKWGSGSVNSERATSTRAHGAKRTEGEMKSNCRNLVVALLAATLFALAVAVR